MRPRPAWVAFLAAASVARAGQHGFSVHDDLLAFPQFQVVFPDAYVLEADAQSKLDFAASQSSAKPASQTSAHAVSVVKASNGRPESGYGSDIDADVPHSYEYMVFESLPYLCSIPQVVETERNDTSTTVSPDEEAKELERARTRGSQLIGAMDGSCLYYVSGWWSYSFCGNSEVKQFHQLPPGQNGAPHYPPVEDTNVPSYVLGHYRGTNSLDTRRRSSRTDSQKSSDYEADTSEEKATDLVEVQSSGNLKYLVQRLEDGTLCDLTGRPRKVEVQYHCAPGPTDKISSIKEVSTCSYRMIIYTPRLCEDVAFQPPPEIPQHQIVCQEIIPESGVSDWKARQMTKSKQAEASRMRIGHESGGEAKDGTNAADGTGEDADSELKTKRPIIGGIELGGQKVVGKPGRRIDPPKEFLAPQNSGKSRVETLVQYDPNKNGGKVQMMSEKNLRELDIAPEDIEEIKSMAEEMYKIGADRRWKIVMAEAEQGVRVLSGVYEEEVVLDENEADKLKAGKKTDKKPPKKTNKKAQKDQEVLEKEEAPQEEFGTEEEYFNDEL